MSQLNAFNLTNAVRRRLVDFALDSNFVRNVELTEICRRLWEGRPERGGLISDLWVEGAFPSETAEETLNSLARQGKFAAELVSHLDRRNAVPRDRQLYRHQLESIIAAQEKYSDDERPALVITAGTGAGKTESFLLPILNHLWASTRLPGEGIGCLILYPMNALVNDQVDRLYGWLKGQDRLKLLHFTSETPENKRFADQQGVPVWEACRLRTREEARRNPPDILITNYSMLEYMLCRPQDAVFFGAGLKAIVLDEAHLYTGTLAAEITLLLRRLLDRCGLRSEQVLQIATSATIGTGAAGELESFASQLFTKSKSLVRAIRGTEQRAVYPEPAPPVRPPSPSEVAEREFLQSATIEQNEDGETRLAENSEECDRLVEVLPLLVGNEVVSAARKDADGKPAMLLHRALAHAPLLQQIENILWEQRRLPLRDLAGKVWGNQDDVAVRATIAVLQMGAAARARINDYPLLPHRLHLLARPADGLVVCLNPDCSGDEELKPAGLGCVTSGFTDRCPHCRHAMLSLYRCGNCGETALAGVNGRDGGLGLMPVPPYESSGGESLLSWRPLDGVEPRVIEPKTGRLRGIEADGLTVYPVTICPRCNKESDGNWRPFSTSIEWTLSILAETALAELPEFPAPHRQWLPARGRRMLAFSDSRQEAARLGPRLTMQHEIYLVRAALARAAQKGAPSDKHSQQYLHEMIEMFESQLRQPNLPESVKLKILSNLEDSRRQLKEQMAGGSIKDWSEMLAAHPIIAELMGVGATDTHLAADWPERAQERWNENRRVVKDWLPDLLGRELARAVRGSASVETLGLLEVTYPGLDQIPPPSSFVGRLPNQPIRDAFVESWVAYLTAICDSLRRDGALSLGSLEADASYPFGKYLVGRWCAQETTVGPRLIMMLGKRRRVFSEKFLISCGLGDEKDDSLTADLLRLVFEALRANIGTTLPWLQLDNRQSDKGIVPVLQIDFRRLGLRAPAQLYRCERTGHIWPWSVNGLAPEDGCDRLRPVTAEELDNDPRVGRQRRELQQSTVFAIGLWAEEHSAQLSAGENRRLQDLFKIGVRNILSSTTTLELGIDIGGLNAVLMGNTPPGKANYLQRSGRAGRRADGSSVVITYTRPRPFDREVFRRFGDYLGFSLRRPRVLLERLRVIQRHAHAFLLGEFFRTVYPPGTRVGAMNAFGDMGRFCGEILPRKWNRGENKPELRLPIADWQAVEADWWDGEREEPGLEGRFLDFLRWIRDAGEETYRPRLENLFRHTPLQIDSGNWSSLFDSIIERCQGAVQSWREDYRALREAWQAINPIAPQARAHAGMLRYQMSCLYEMTVIEAFADRQFLPRYGFPIGLQKLQVVVPDENDRKSYRIEDQFRLERAGLLALGEYVPGSQLLVGGKLVTSRGLMKHWTGATPDTYIGLRGQYTRCANDHFYYEIANSLAQCPICEEPANQSPRNMLFPKHGFTSAVWDPPRRSVEVERIGRVERATITFAKRENGMDEDWKDFAGIAGLTARYREDGELLIFNEGTIWDDDQDDSDGTVMGTAGRGFAICLKCGYAESERHFGKGRIDLPSSFITHRRLTDNRINSYCWNDDEAPVLRNQTLAARETTDVLLLSFTSPRDGLAKDEQFIWTLAHALRISGAKLLEVDTRELGAMTTGTPEGIGAVLHDNTPGGSGHVRELMELGREWFDAALKSLYLGEEHHQRCETACLDCLLTFDTQREMSQGLLQRRKTWEILDQLLKGDDSPPADLDSGPTKERSALKNEERLARGRQRMNR